MARKTAKAKRLKAPSSFGNDILEAAEQMLAHSRGQLELSVEVFVVPDRVNVKQIRRKLELSQSQFAGRYGLPLRSLQQWEQGRQKPDTTVRAYLTVIQHDPEAVRKALARTAVALG